MKRTALLLLTVIFALAFFNVGCKRTVPIQTYGNPSLSSYGNLSQTQVRDCIIRGGSKIGWQMMDEKPGVVVGTWKTREHSVTVEIPYSTQSYTIKYRSSVNLLAETGEIHRNYPRWIDRLNRNINAELSAIKK